jgi:hypothetical protein
MLRRTVKPSHGVGTCASTCGICETAKPPKMRRIRIVHILSRGGIPLQTQSRHQGGRTRRVLSRRGNPPAQSAVIDAVSGNLSSEENSAGLGHVVGVGRLPKQSARPLAGTRWQADFHPKIKLLGCAPLAQERKWRLSLAGWSSSRAGRLYICSCHHRISDHAENG